VPENSSRGDLAIEGKFSRFVWLLELPPFLLFWMEIINLYTDLANHSDKDFGWEKGIQNAINHGYKKKWIDIPFTLKNPPIYNTHLLAKGGVPQGILSYCAIHLIAKA